MLCQPFILLATENYDQIKNGNQQLSLIFQSTFTDDERKTTYQWLKEVSRALRTVYGEYPQDHFRITIKRSRARPGPVPWGHVERGDPTNVLLVINPEYGYDALINDWTAFHELSHLLIPYRGHGNVWFSEGLATYYQNIIQGRLGLLNQSQMWGKIAAGFERGKKQQHWNNTNLTEVSDQMRENRQFMRVHWSGVLYWLSADVQLRKLGKGTLDDALKLLKDCCEFKSMSAKAIAHKLDTLTSSNVFVPLFEIYCESYEIPDYLSLLTELGVTKTTNTISFNKSASLASIRQKIYQP